MRGEGVPQRMRCDGFRDAAALTCKLASLADGIAADGPFGNVARKQPVPRVSIPPVRSQDLKQLRRQHDVATLTVKCVAETYVVNSATSAVNTPFATH